MINSVKLELSGGDFQITHGEDFSVTSDCLNHLVYEKDGIWHVVSDPCHGKYAKTVITLPYLSTFTNFQVNLSDGALNLCKTDCKSLEFNLKNASAETDTVTVQNLYISIGYSDLRVLADAQFTNIDCGYGTLDLRLTKGNYSIKSQCGMGKVTLNSSLLSKKFENSDGDRKINVICGMGNVNINT